MAATATHAVVGCQIPLAALAAVTVAVMGVTALLRTVEVEMRHIMVRVPAVANCMQKPTVLLY